MTRTIDQIQQLNFVLPSPGPTSGYPALPFEQTGGVNDLKQGIIRFIGEPEKRVQRDPARMMRVIRHGARNGFTIEPQTWQAVIDHRDKLKLFDLTPDDAFRIPLEELLPPTEPPAAVTMPCP